MSEMINRVGLHIEAAGMAWKAANGGDACGWADIPNEVFARAAIEALRDPTKAMIDAAWNNAETQTEQAEEVWCAMLAAAMEEAA